MGNDTIYNSTFISSELFDKPLIILEDDTELELAEGCAKAQNITEFLVYFTRNDLSPSDAYPISTPLHWRGRINRLDVNNQEASGHTNYTLQGQSCYQALEELLGKYLKNYNHGKAVVFSNDKSRLRADALKFQNCLVIDGDMDTAQKREVINNFVYGDHRILMGTKLISNGIDVSDVNLVVFSGYSPQDIEFIQGLGRIRGQGLRVVLNHNQFCGANVMGRFYGFKDKDHHWCCGRPEDEKLLTMFDSVIGDEDNRSKVHEDSAILNSSFRVEDLGLDLNFGSFEVTSTPCKNGGGEKRSLDEDIDLENLSEMYHEVFSEYPELNTCKKEGLTSPIGYLVLIHLLLVQIIKFSRPCLNEAASCLAGRLIQSSTIFDFLAPTLVADDCMDVFGFGVYKYIYILK